MRRELTDAEMRWAEGLHIQWVQQCEAEGMEIPPEPIDSVIAAAIVGFCRLAEAQQFAINQATAELMHNKAHGSKAH